MMLPLLAVLLMIQDPPSLEALRDLGDFTVTLSGPALKSFPSAQNCVYWEWAAGEMKNGEWALRVGGTHSGTRLIIDTPRGRLDLAHGNMRLYLSAAASHRFTRTTAARSTPTPLPELLKEVDPLNVEEYILQSGRTYYARIETETTLLPPQGNAPPERRSTLVLAISDKPFKEGKAQSPLTPSFVGLSR